MTVYGDERSDRERRLPVKDGKDLRNQLTAHAVGVGQPSAPDRRTLRRWVRSIARLVLWPVVVGAIVIPQLPRMRDASVDFQAISFPRTVMGFVLVMASIVCYSGLTRTALGDRTNRISHQVVYRIQLSTRALANVVPGGNATASALGFRLLTHAGASTVRAGVALATAGLCSAVVLNVLFWIALAISIPLRGSDRTFILAAVLGLALLAAVATIAHAIARGSGPLLGFARRIIQRLSLDPDRLDVAVTEMRQRLTDLRNDRPLLRRLVAWSSAQWALDMAALWVFLSAFGIRLDPLVLILVFGAANIAAAVPITPGGLGVVEGVYIASLVRLGFTFEAATLGIVTYRLAHYVFPTIAGGASYLTLKTGPWRLAPSDRVHQHPRLRP